MKRRLALGIGALGSLLAAPALLAWRHAPPSTGSDVGLLPSLPALPGLHDASRAWSPASMRGRAWALNVWASWCGPCRDEHPVWTAAARESGLPLVGLATRDDPDAAREWLLRLGDPFHAVALDRDGRAAAALGLVGVPASFLIDAGGIVRYFHAGPLTTALWAEVLRPRLAGLQA